MNKEVQRFLLKHNIEHYEAMVKEFPKEKIWSRALREARWLLRSV